MAQNIRTALDRIKVVEEGLAITSGVDGPETLSIKRVYKYFPKQDGQVEAPCFMHGFSLLDVQHVAGLRSQLYLVRTQFWSGNADKDRAADVSAAFLAKWLDAFSDDLLLNGNVSGPIRVRGGDPTLAVLEYGGLSSVGLDLIMEIPMGPEAVTVGI